MRRRYSAADSRDPADLASRDCAGLSRPLGAPSARIFGRHACRGRRDVLSEHCRVLSELWHAMMVELHHCVRRAVSPQKHGRLPERQDLCLGELLDGAHCDSLRPARPPGDIRPGRFLDAKSTLPSSQRTRVRSAGCFPRRSRPGRSLGKQSDKQFVGLGAFRSQPMGASADTVQDSEPTYRRVLFETTPKSQSSSSTAKARWRVLTRRKKPCAFAIVQ